MGCLVSLIGIWLILADGLPPWATGLGWVLFLGGLFVDDGPRYKT